MILLKIASHVLTYKFSSCFEHDVDSYASYRYVCMYVAIGYEVHVVLVCCLSLLAGAIVIEKQPSSLLIPVNEIGVFSCVASCSSPQCVGRWRINDSYAHPYNSNEPDEMFVNMGFMFPPDQTYQNQHTLTLMVNASEAVNNIRLQCEFRVGITEYASSETANLLVIPGMYINTAYATYAYLLACLLLSILIFGEIIDKCMHVSITCSSTINQQPFCF